MSAMLAAALMLLPQTAPPAADLADAKCAVAMALLQDVAETKDKPDMQSAMLFFLGKIAGRSGQAGVAPALNSVIAQMKAVGAEGAAAIAEQCAPQISDATKGL